MASRAPADFEVAGLGERTLIDDLAGWSAPAPFGLRFLLQAPDDPSLLVEAGEIWRGDGRGLAALGRAFRDPQESRLEGLGGAARLFPPIATSLREARPEALGLDVGGAWRFLSEGAPVLAAADCPPIRAPRRIMGPNLASESGS
jgi:hypothetical protein